MDIDLLSRMVKELIIEHDQVGLPGVGTFVAEMVPASFSDKGYTINPPYRRLSFYPSRLEDTLLIDFYAASNQLDQETARTYITQYLAELKSVLQERKSIILPGLGRLRATKENALFFVADEGLDIFPAGVGLRPVSLKSHILEEEPVVIDVPPPVSGREVENRKRNRNRNRRLNREQSLRWRRRSRIKSGRRKERSGMTKKSSRCGRRRNGGWCCCSCC